MPDVKERLETLGIFPFLMDAPEPFGEYIASETRKYAKIIRDAGIRVE